MALKYDFSTGNLLSKDEHLCTTCCPQCENSLMSSVKVLPSHWLTYTGFQGDNQAPHGYGFWRIMDWLVDIETPGGGGVLASGTVSSSKAFNGLGSQYKNITVDETYFDFSYSCDGLTWIILNHHDVKMAYNIWTVELPRGTGVDMDAVRATIEPVWTSYAQWRLFVDCVWPSWPNFTFYTSGNLIDYGNMDGLGYFVGLDSYYEPENYFNPSIWLLACYT